MPAVVGPAEARKTFHRVSMGSRGMTIVVAGNMSVGQDQVPSRSPEVEAQLAKIRGVVASRVAYGPSGEIEAVHVLAAQGRSPKLIVRDIEAVFAAQFGQDLDHRKVSVAQLDVPDNEPTEIKRPLLESVRIERGRSKLTIVVALSGGGETFHGEASGASTSDAAPRLAAAAVLAALQAYVNGWCSLDLADLVPFELGGRAGIIAAVTLGGSGLQNEQLLGCAFNVGADPIDTAIKACLDSVNRRLTHVSWTDLNN